jgi:hypothetical protein
MKALNRTLLNFITLLAVVLITTTLSAQNCGVRINRPTEGTQVAGTALVSGTATIPPNGHLWILAHQVGINGYWPQGSGAAQINGRNWEILVYFGIPGNLGLFEVIAIVVDDQTHRNLNDWVQKAPNTSPAYQPIPLPTALEGCAIVNLRVDKTRN